MRKPAFGYKIEDDRVVEDKDQMLLLQEAKDLLEIKAMSLREAAEWLSSSTGRRISHEGLNKRLKRPLKLYESEGLLSDSAD